MSDTNSPLFLGNESALEIHNCDSISNRYYNIVTPLHVIVMYNTCGTPNVTNNLFSVSPLGAYLDINRMLDKGTSEPHRHKYFELLLVLKGEIMQEIEGKEYLYTAGSCCLINPNITHTERFLGEATIVFIGLSLDFVRLLISEASNSCFSESNGSLSNSVLTFMNENLYVDTQKSYLDFFPIYQNNGTTSFLKHISDSLVHTLFSPCLGEIYTVKGLLWKLFDYLDQKKNYHIIDVELKSKNDFLLFARIKHLIIDTNGRISRSELEAQLHYSGNYLNSIVKRYTGMNVFDYGMSFCLETAAELLVTTTTPISTIIETLYFTNQGHFYKLFKKKYGLLPKEYRKNFSRIN